MAHEVFGPYRLEALLGRGGMGEVWRAHDTVKERDVALKRLLAKFADDDEFQRRFQRESKIVAGLNEPHVIPIHDFGEIDGRLFLTMRLVDGADLGTVLSRSGPLSPTRAVAVVEHVAAALDAAHAGGLVHRDIKPSNVLISGADFAYLVDFGIARLSTATALTATGTTIGTFDYMSPERLVKGKCDHHADIYALGCLLYQSLTGSTPFPAEGIEAQMYHHVHSPPPRPSAERSELPVGLDEVVQRAMAKDPGDRYPSAGALATAARAALAPSEIAEPEGRKSVPPTRVPGPADETRVPGVARKPRASEPADETKVPGVADKAGSGGALATVLGADGRSAVSSSEGAAPKLADTPSTRPLKPRKRKLGLILGGVVVVVIGSILGLVQYLTPAPILLLAATAPGPDPFGPDFTVGRGALPGTAMVSSLPAGAAGTLSGTTDGLYRSVMGAAACDRAAMVGYFRDRAPLAQAWSAGLDGREAAGYISTLTPTLLRDDTRVTVFGYADGKAEAHQATLQAGTAVLVDGTGMPQVRCAGADPLTPSDDHAGGPTTQGSVWPGYEPGAVITVERGSQASEFGLVDLAGTPFRRPVGTAGERDIAQTPESGRIDGSYSLVTGTATKCVGFSDCADPNSEPYPVSLQVSCSTGCTATSDEWDGPLPMVRSGDRWEIAGSLKPELTCENNAPTTLQLSFQPTAAEVQGGRWSVTRVTGEYRNVMSRETATCIATDLARKITGTRD